MSARPASTDPDPAPSRSGMALTILGGTAVLALLYFGREVLEPITLAGLLSLLVTPLVRLLKRTGMGQVPAVLGSVLALTLCLLGLAGLIGLQVVSMASSLPQYETTIRDKMEVVQEATVGRVEAMRGEAGRMMSRLADQPASAVERLATRMRRAGADGDVVPVEIHERPATPVQLLRQVFSSVWGPLGSAGIVLIVLVFVLLEHEALRDRLIRLAGGADLRGTTHAFNDAGARLSRFFVSQFAVNVGVGVVVGLGLAAIGLPHAVLWAVLTALLRFVPYAGVPVAGVSAALLGAAVDPGWSLMFLTLGLFVVVEVIAAQAVEPLLYGHSTGLSPLSVVIAAIFWSWLWGPVGLLVSTPLTLCLVVAGRHVRALRFLDILLGDTPALTMSQHFYQRALSGDAEEIIASARVFLKRGTFANYCDVILLPALQLAAADLACGGINPQQQLLVKSAIAQVIEALGPDERRRRHRPRRSTVLDDPSVGLHLRHRRESVFGKYQGPLQVPPGSIALCLGLGSLRDDLLTELLVRILRDLDIDARHFSPEDLDAGPPPGAVAGSVATVFIVSAFPDVEWSRGREVAVKLRQRLSGAILVGVVPRAPGKSNPALPLDHDMDLVAFSFEEAVQQARVRYPIERDKPAPAPAAG